MRICVVLPGEEFLSSAGVRIRYQRIGARLATQGRELKLELIDGLPVSHKPRHDFYIISKCYDARSLILAKGLHGLGLRVGVDIFDDYYSQADDSRFVHLRRWLREIASSLSFALCSTPLMLRQLEALLPQIPRHMMNDPFDALDVESLALRLDARLQRARSTGLIDIAWFGIGDNGYFPVGLADLAAFGSSLASLSSGGFRPRLSILTNRRAMTAGAMQALARLPVPWRIEEWSETAEACLLRESYACFLPVNAQRFSTVKSLNRAVTALTGGVQVLSAGYPLYDIFTKLIYRDGAELRGGIMKGEPRVRGATLPTLSRILDKHANPEQEAGLLAKFLGQLASPPRLDHPQQSAVIHGRLSVGSVHKYAQRNGHLSVAGPKPSELSYDVRIMPHPETGRGIILLSAAAMKRLRPYLVPQAQETVTLAGKAINYLSPETAGLDTFPQSRLMEYDAVFLANYAEDIGRTRSLLTALFGEMPDILSESVSPFWQGAEASRRGAA